MHKFTLRSSLFLLFAGLSAASIAQSNSFANGTDYKQTFDNMLISATAPLPTGWRADVNTNPRTLGAYSTAVTATQFIAGANMANPLTGGIYNFGAGTSANGNGDRAVGGLNTSNNPTSVNIYFDLQNTGTNPIANFNVAYSIEKYRNGNNNDGSAVQLYYSPTGAAGSWIPVPTAYSVYAGDNNNNGFSPAPDQTQTKYVTAAIAPAGGLAANAHIYLAWNISVPVAAIGGNASNSIALGIDDVKISTASAAAVPGLFYKSHQSGNWNAMTTWESSADDVTYTYPAAGTPTSADYTITILSGHNVAVSANTTTDQTYINTGGTLTIGNGVTLTVADGVGADLTINGTLANNGSLVLQSINSGQNDVGTASIGSSYGTITGSGTETVQRFISAASDFSSPTTAGKNAWRLLTAPVWVNPLRASIINSSIFTNWQNNGVNTATTGTTVTGPTYLAAAGGQPGAPVADANGLDYYTSGYSMKAYNGTALVGVDNTRNLGTLFDASGNKSYFIFINGDRTTKSTVSGGAPNQTDLSATGNLRLGTITMGNPSGANFALVGNPYASPVDLNQFRLGNTTSGINSTYWYWDPYLSGTYGLGGYVTVSFDAAGTAIITPEGGAAGSGTSTETKFLQSGQAMFIQGSGVAPTTPVTFTEDQKVYNTVNNIFRTQSAAQIDKLRVNLNVVSSGAPVLIDGIVAAFNSSYNAAVDNYDAAKFYNIDESISFMRNNTALSIERRPTVTSDDVLYLNLTNLKTAKSYQLEINPSMNTGLTAYLVDNYLKTTTPVDLSKPTVINFTINSDAASTGASRFYISFAKPVSLVTTGKDGLAVYPNPVTNGVINLQMNNMAQGVYVVRVMNGMGQVIATKQINHAAGSSTEAIQLGKSLIKGIYQLEVVKPDNGKFSTKVMAN